jgi:sulfate adenylyltransferase subunit 2
VDRLNCCGLLKTDALTRTLSGEGPRFRFNHTSGAYERDPNTEAYTGVIVGARADEEGSRSKERYFSPRSTRNQWDIGEQPPEFWQQYKTEFAPGTHVRIHPLLDWTELNIWHTSPASRFGRVALTSTRGRAHATARSAARTAPITSTARTVRTSSAARDRRPGARRRTLGLRRMPPTAAGSSRRCGSCM